MSDRKKTANYRRCFLTDGQNSDASDGKTLQELLVLASKSVKRPWLRCLGVAGSANHLLTDLVSKNSCLCGEIVYYEAGRMIPLVDVNQDGSTWQDIIPPKDTVGNDRQFQEQSVIFAVRENHVALLQSVTLQADQVQAFLAWFLQTKGSLVPNALIALKNLPAREALEKLKDHHIKGIKFGEKLVTTVREEVPPKDGEKPRKRKRYTRKLETSPRLFQMLKSFGIDDPILESISGMDDPGAIDVDIEIRYRSRSEKEGIAVLHALAATLGPQENLETEIQLDGKSSIKGSELTVRDDIMVQAPNGCVSLDDAFTKLSRWLMEQIKSGKIA